MIDIRIARESEKEELKKLWQECFFEKEPFLSFWFDNICDTDMAVAAIKNEKIIGALHMREYTLFSYGRKYKAIYILGFGVSKSERKKGIGSKILEYAHDICKKQNADFVFLLPDIDGYYEKFGYIPCSETVMYEFKSENIKNGNSLNIKQFKSADGLNEIYERYAEKYDIYLNRNMEECYEEYSMYNGGICGISDKGYMVYTCDSEKIEVFEAAYTDIEVLHAFLGFLKSKAGKEMKIVFHAAADDKIKKIFYGNKIKKTVLRGIMAKPLKNFDAEEVFGFCGGRSFINIF